jgi:hypothetical protein
MGFDQSRRERQRHGYNGQKRVDFALAVPIFPA